MGARIAALFASVGVPVYLLDITEELARAAIARTQAGDLVSAGSFADGIPLLRGYDWVLEAVVEELEAKRELWRRVSPCISPDAIASTNTSGLSIAAIANGMAPEFQRQFLGVHFFNPPANLHLVEIVRSPQTRPNIAAAAIRFVSERLAKGVIEARDTPNFIANRIGAFFSASAQSLAIEGNWTIEEVDHMTGPVNRHAPYGYLSVDGRNRSRRLGPRPGISGASFAALLSRDALPRLAGREDRRWILSKKVPPTGSRRWISKRCNTAPPPSPPYNPIPSRPCPSVSTACFAIPIPPPLS